MRQKKFDILLSMLWSQFLLEHFPSFSVVSVFVVDSTFCRPDGRISISASTTASRKLLCGMHNSNKLTTEKNLFSIRYLAIRYAMLWYRYGYNTTTQQTRGNCLPSTWRCHISLVLFRNEIIKCCRRKENKYRNSIRQTKLKRPQHIESIWLIYCTLPATYLWNSYLRALTTFPKSS